MAFWSRSLVVLLFAAVVAGGCGSGGGGTSPAPTPTPVTVTSLTVSTGGVAAVAGDTVQFTATATFSDGTTQNVTGQVMWESSNTAVVTITSGGLATFLAQGDADVKATYRSSSGTTMSGTSHITVAPRPTSRYTLSGTVTDATTGSMLSGVSARILDGPDANRSGVTDGSGRFAIANVSPGSFLLQFTRSDYETRSIPVSVSGDTAVTMQLTAQTQSVTRFYGTYNTTLTIHQQTCDFPFPVGPTGTFKIEGNTSGSAMTITIVERGTTRTYTGSMKADGSFSGNGGGIIAGFTPPQNKHEYTGSVSGTSNGTRVDATEFVNFTIPCPGAKMQIGYIGTK